MNDVQENKFSMYVAVESFFVKYAAKIGVIPALVTAVDEFMVLRGSFNELEMLAKGTAGKAAATRLAKVRVADLTGHVAKLVKAYGFSVKDARLQEIGRVSRRAITRARDSLVQVDARLVFNAAVEKSAELADFGLSASLLGELDAAIVDYNNAVGAMSVAKARRSAALKELPGLFRRCDGLLRDRIDGLMENFRVSERQFFDEYRSVRMIVDRR